MAKGDVFKSLADAMQAVKDRSDERKSGGQSYGARAEQFDKRRDEISGWEWQVLRDNLPILPDGQRMKPADAKVLDVGCGTGTSTRGLRLDGFTNVIGADPDPRMTEKARERHDGIKYVEASASKLPFPDASFDVITIYWAFENFGGDEASLIEMKRVLKPNGILVIITGTIEGFAKEGRKIIKKYMQEMPAQSPYAIPDGQSSAGLLKDRYAFSRVDTFEREQKIPYTVDEAFHSFDASIIRNLVPKQDVGEMDAELRTFCEAEAQKDRTQGGAGILYRPKRIIIDIAHK